MLNSLTCNLYIAEVTPLTNEDTFQKYYDLVDDDRRKKVDAIKVPGERNRSLCAGALVCLAMEDLGLTKENLRPTMDLETEPDLSSPFYYNLSHSGERAILAVADVPVGCDTEPLSRWKEESSKSLGIAGRFFAEGEYEKLRALHEEGGSQAEKNLFFAYWTLKESVIKALGAGLSQPLDSFEIYFEEGLPGMRGCEPSGNICFEDYSLYTPDIGDGYVYAVCLKSTERYDLQIIRKML